jgi:hypothetical protein
MMKKTIRYASGIFFVIRFSKCFQLESDFICFQKVVDVKFVLCRETLACAVQLHQELSKDTSYLTV